jgi:hypothetical protein
VSAQVVINSSQIFKTDKIKMQKYVFGCVVGVGVLGCLGFQHGKIQDQKSELEEMKRERGESDRVLLARKREELEKRIQTMMRERGESDRVLLERKKP